MQNAYWELKREMSNLHLVTQVQAELLRKLKTPTTIKKGKLIFAGNSIRRAAGYRFLSKSHQMILISQTIYTVCSQPTYSLLWLHSHTGQLHT